MARHKKLGMLAAEKNRKQHKDKTADATKQAPKETSKGVKPKPLTMTIS